MRIYGQSKKVHIMTWNNKKALGRGERASERASVCGTVVKQQANNHQQLEWWHEEWQKEWKENRRTYERNELDLAQEQKDGKLNIMRPWLKTSVWRKAKMLQNINHFYFEHVGSNTIVPHARFHHYCHYSGTKSAYLSHCRLFIHHFHLLAALNEFNSSNIQLTPFSSF